MNEQIKDGGPAFPILDTAIGYNADIRQLAPGVSLRDYFAAKAIYVAAQTLADAIDSGSELKEGISECDVIATMSYKIADAMLAARKATP